MGKVWDNNGENDHRIFSREPNGDNVISNCKDTRSRARCRGELGLSLRDVSPSSQCLPPVDICGREPDHEPTHATFTFTHTRHPPLVHMYHPRHPSDAVAEQQQMETLAGKRRRSGESVGGAAASGAAGAEGSAAAVSQGGGSVGGGQTASPSGGPPENLSPGYGAGYDAGFLAASQGRAPPPGPTVAESQGPANPAIPATSSTGGVARARDAAADDVPDLLLCCVCFDAPRGRIESCVNGHILCAEAGDGSCLAKLREQASGHHEEGEAHAMCPVCRCLLPEAGASTRPLFDVS